MLVINTCPISWTNGCLSLARIHSCPQLRQINCHRGEFTCFSLSLPLPLWSGNSIVPWQSHRLKLSDIDVVINLLPIFLHAHYNNTVNFGFHSILWWAHNNSISIAYFCGQIAHAKQHDDEDEERPGTRIVTLQFLTALYTIWLITHAKIWFRSKVHLMPGPARLELIQALARLLSQHACDSSVIIRLIYHAQISHVQVAVFLWPQFSPLSAPSIVSFFFAIS